ncbi:sigma factor-like helix-turn-helix DNA-binding protein [Streptomyces sp. NPDC002666]
MTDEEEDPYTLADLPSIERYLRVRSRAYRWQADWADCVQEGVIYAWRDIESGRGFSRAHIRNRAAQRIRAVATSGHHPFTGTPERHRTGTFYGELSPVAQKVGAFIDEYAALHDGYMPPGRAIADAVGCPISEVKRYVTQVRGRRGTYSSALLKPDGKVDRKAYRMLPLDGWGSGPFESDTTPEITAASGEPSFEAGAVDDMAYRQMLADVFGDDERTATILGMYVHDGYSQREIGERFGVTQMQISRIVKKALAKARAYYESDGTAWV